MLERPDFDKNNEQIICEMNGRHSDMHMNIRVKSLLAGESFSLCDGECESALLILSGEGTVTWEGETRTMKRANPFEKKPYCLHVPKNTEVRFEAAAQSEILIQQTDNDVIFTPVFYTPDDCLYQEFGKGQWEGTGHRICSTVFDYDNAPYSNMVLGEVFNLSGRWSSYPPHHHPQPEVYYYRFDKPQGFGACFLGDDVYKSTDRSCSFITDGNDHEQVTAPGYCMYYVWMIRHIENDPWYKTTRFYATEHEWLTKAD